MSLEDKLHKELVAVKTNYFKLHQELESEKCKNEYLKQDLEIAKQFERNMLVVATVGWFIALAFIVDYLVKLGT